MDSCHVLYEYAVFVAKIKRYRESMELKEAIDLAVRECIEENILRDFLEQHRREVCDMCLTEFEEDVLREEMEEGLAEGIEKGLAKGRSEERKTLLEIVQKLKEGKTGTVSCRWNGKRICGFCYHVKKASIICNNPYSI